MEVLSRVVEATPSVGEAERFAGGARLRAFEDLSVSETIWSP